MTEEEPLRSIISMISDLKDADEALCRFLVSHSEQNLMLTDRSA